ncbi:autophagy protein Apg5-domain-containing protein [Morchella snyderi]|uniref:Autophagy protein 5 n=2 Tax=Morchella sect. Distantes TaxID=1051054 RepID=A0A3N4KRG0_9PEZI|nr:autophagy protein Apg5-domain-containing protein [Morchella snyderi]RPB12098.1 APG5-domain-containing protein [Morchella conica CCBAS932]
MESSDSKSIRKAIWSGSIPCKILLDPGECRVFDDSDPYYLTIPRISYLPLFIPQIYKFFKHFLIDQEVSKEETAWFEFESVPLKWHWPVGLLYDLFTARDPSSRDVEDEEHQLPWTLILHFRDYPHKHLMRLDNPAACHDAWMNLVKEADYVRHGSAKAVMNLTKAESTGLWDSLQSYDFDKYWSVYDKLISPISTPTRNIPLRVYIPGTGSRVIQRPVPPLQASRDHHTVGTALHLFVPELFPSQRVCVLAKPVIHGVVIAMGTPLIDLMREAVYPDGFLHVSLAMMA